MMSQQSLKYVSEQTNKLIDIFFSNYLINKIHILNSLHGMTNKWKKNIFKCKSICSQ